MLYYRVTLLKPKMKLSKYILILFCTYGFSVNAQGLDGYKWKNRVLLLFDRSNETQALISQLNRFTSLKAKCSERDLTLLILTNRAVFFDDATEVDKLDTNIIRNELDIPENFKGVVLVGKDGGKKFQGKFEVNPQTIFDLIDSMPMRRAEMRNK